MDDQQAAQMREARAIHDHQVQDRMSPFVNSRKSTNTAMATTTTDNKDTKMAKATMRRWLAVTDPTPALLHGFLVFEVSWRDVHGINYFNDLLTDTSLALEARYIRRRRSWRARIRIRKNIPPEEEKEEDTMCCTSPVLQKQRYNDTLLLFRFRDASLPFKLRQIIMSDIRLLTLLESGLPSWVIFFQSYPLLCHLYRPWMRPLARSLYVLASLATVLIGFYDLYKNVPLLKSAAARICGPLFEWIETWDMVTRIQYLGTILFLRNLRRLLQGLLELLNAAGALLRAVVAPLADLGLCELAGTVGLLASHAWELVADLAEAVWAPFDVVLDCAAGVVASMWPVLQVVVLPARLAVALAGCAGSLLSNSYNFVKETLSSIFELNHMTSEAQQTAFDITTLKTLWNDLFSQIFRAIRGILNGILVFFYSCNRHRLSISNHARSRLRHVLRIARLAPHRNPTSCHCNSTKHP